MCILLTQRSACVCVCVTVCVYVLLTYLVQSHDVVLEAGASSGDHHTSAHVLAQVLAELGGLQSQLPRGFNDDGWRERERER